MTQYIKRILVLGGTGFVGRALCEQLVQRNGGGGGRISVPTRHANHANRVRSLPTVEPVVANVHDDAQLAGLVAGCDAVINLIAILHGSEADFRRVHVDLPRRLAAACAKAGVQRLLHVSALGAAADAPSDYLRSKAAGEAVLTGAGLNLTILRPSVIFGAEDSFLRLFASLQGWVPVLPLAGSHARFQPVWVEDVASALVRALDDPATIGKVYECAGPDVMTLSELVRCAGQWSGRARPQIALPDWMGRLQALAMECLPGEPLMSRDNMRSMQVPNVASGTLPGLADLGITPAALQAVVPQYLNAQFKTARMDRWRASARRG